MLTASQRFCAFFCVFSFSPNVFRTDRSWLQVHQFSTLTLLLQSCSVVVSDLNGKKKESHWKICCLDVRICWTLIVQHWWCHHRCYLFHWIFFLLQLINIFVLTWPHFINCMLSAFKWSFRWYRIQMIWIKISCPTFGALQHEDAATLSMHTEISSDSTESLSLYKSIMTFCAFPFSARLIN